MVFLFMFLIVGSLVGGVLGLAGAAYSALRRKKPWLFAVGAATGMVGIWIGGIVWVLLAYIVQGRLSESAAFLVNILLAVVIAVLAVAASALICGIVGRTRGDSSDTPDTVANYQRPDDT